MRQSVRGGSCLSTTGIGDATSTHLALAEANATAATRRNDLSCILCQKQRRLRVFCWTLQRDQITSSLRAHYTPFAIKNVLTSEPEMCMERSLPSLQGPVHTHVETWHELRTEHSTVARIPHKCASTTLHSARPTHCQMHNSPPLAIESDTSRRSAPISG